MKLSGCRICIATTILVLMFLLCPVAADEINPTITHVFFEKAGVPYNGSVQFTVECYGYTWKSWDGSAPEDLAARINHTSEMVYTYSASCPSYGCTIYEPYYHTERLIVDRCDLKGQTAEGDFLLQNFSRSPVPSCTDLHQVDIGKGRNQYYRITPEYSRCVNDTRRRTFQCDHYLVTCNTANDTECGNLVRDDGHYGKETPSYRACMDTIDRERADCDQLLDKIDPASMIMWIDPRTGREEGPALRNCTARFTIPPTGPGMPSDQRVMNATPEVPVSAPLHKRSPVESLYCSIQRFFGARC
jgi:hypothetical protein